MYAQKLMELLFGKFTVFFKNEEVIRAIWKMPDILKKALLDKLSEKGYGIEQPNEIKSLINFVLSKCVDEGVSELSQTKLSILVNIKYRAVVDAVAELGIIATIKNMFIGFQQHLYKKEKGNMSVVSPNLTKSHFVLGQRCHKALHFNVFSPERANQSSNLELKLRHEGTEVGKYARSLHTNGILIDSEDIEIAIERTQKNISEGALTLFEAAFRFDDVVIRADILTRQSVNGPWKLYEVKAITFKSNDEGRKEDFRQDIAIQAWVLRQCGIALEGIYLMHLNSECVYPNLQSLFISKDYWSEITPLLTEIPKEIAKLKKVLRNQPFPNTSLGPHCEQSQGCSFKETCWSHIPNPSVFDIPNCRQRWKHFEDGRIDVHHLSESDFQSSTHLRVLKCYQENQPFFDKQMAQEMLRQWNYPLSYFDIEAIAYPVPRYPNSRPYQNLPFQFSCHILRDENSELEHYEFLHNENNDPRFAFIQKMLEVLPQSGSIVVYHQTYEISRFKELARDFPEYAQAINDLIPRVVDLKKVIMDTVYYPAFMGSFSIKKVAPVLLGEEASYDHLEVGDGIEAMLSYEKMLNLVSSVSKKQEIRKDLLKYCKQDTLLMVHLHQWFFDNLAL